MTWRNTRESTLLRVAPWVDLPVLREDFLKRCDSIVARWNEGVPNAKMKRYAAELEGYKNGEHRTAPSALDFERQLLHAINNRYADDYQRDHHYGIARREILRYFLRASDWVRI